jgi:hypothetical protein
MAQYAFAQFLNVNREAMPLSAFVGGGSEGFFIPILMASGLALFSRYPGSNFHFLIS